MKITGCQPDSGNPTVRDERGAYGIVSYGGTRKPLHRPKGCMPVTLRLRLRAPYFSPTTRACVQRGSSGTWEIQLFPCRGPASREGRIADEAASWRFGEVVSPHERALIREGTRRKESRHGTGGREGVPKESEKGNWKG